MKNMARGMLLQRSIGLAIMLMVMVLLDPLQSNLSHRLLLPLMAIVAGALILRSTMAVAFATGTLASLAINLDGDLYQAQVYPWFALLALLVVAALLIRRFQTRIRATHTQRWFQRRHKPRE